MDCELYFDVQYRGDDEDYWKLDLALPASSRDEPAPCLVLVHGGGWRGCTKQSDMESKLMRHFAGRGYVAASVEYRLTGVAPHPAQISDVMAAVRWLRTHADEYGIDRESFAAAGHSAGGHLAALLGLLDYDGWREGSMPHADVSCAVQAVVGLSGVYDLTEHIRQGTLTEILLDLLPGPGSGLLERARAASPATYVRAGAPPFLLMHGTEDPCCRLAQAEDMAERLSDAGAEDVTLRVVQGAGHGLPIDTVKQEMDVFLERVLRK